MIGKKREVNSFFYAIVVAVSLVLAWVALLAGIMFEEYLTGADSEVHLRQSVLVFLLLTLLCMEFTGAYRVGRRRLFEVFYACLVSVLLVNLMMLSLPFFEMPYFRSPWVIIYIICVQSVMFGAWAYVFHRLCFFFFPKKNAVIVADCVLSANDCARKVMLHSREFTVAGEMDYSLWGDLQPDCDLVISYKLSSEQQEILTRMHFEGKIRLCIIPHIKDIGLYCSRQSQFGDLLALHIGSLSLTPGQRFVKRIIDIAGAFLGLLLSGLPILVMAAVIYLQDGKAPFFRQERLTIGGKVFKILKLRSMVPDAEAETGPVLSQQDDARVTPLGGWLRKRRLDELPQLWNVLTGDMSLVGPRPEREHFFRAYSKEMPEFAYRLAVKAGITGMAHVYGSYDTPPEDRLKLDLHYILRYSLLLDTKLLIETARIMFSA